jgi:hypothetical protein
MKHLERHVEQLKARNSGLESMLDLTINERDNYILCLKIIAKGHHNPAHYADVVLKTLGKQST